MKMPGDHPSSIRASTSSPSLFKVGQVVRVVDVSGHVNIIEAVGRPGQITKIISGKIYPYLVEFVLPIMCNCKSKCGTIFTQDWFAEKELVGYIHGDEKEATR